MTAEPENTAYRVLARKYRPTNFDELVGQEALVRTLTNAIDTGRIAQAFMLTGVRGVGKTTTARIVAKALNCIGEDGNGGPTVSPCGVCDNCKAITEDRHVDVQEMDAASRTGVGDIRELIEGVRYRPVSARYKVYILDEVHMLSNNAWNALLKTLEEPPEHVKFIFATTEIRKVPVTVLSRCQRFDLRRVPVEKLVTHFGNVSEKEQVSVEADALSMIARAADGSVRDGLSILDQAIALSGDSVSAEQVRDMLGLADRAQVFELFDAVMRGDAPAALDGMRAMYDAGADPAVVVQDMLDVCYWLTRFKLSPELANQPSTPEIERTRGKDMADKLTMPILSRAWQMLLKGLAETQNAPNPIQAAEMILIRLLHLADLPTPEDAVKKLKEGGAAKAPSSPSSPGSAPNRPAPALSIASGGSAAAAAVPAPAPVEAPAEPVAQTQPQADPDPAPRPARNLPQPKSFREVVQLLMDRREGLLVKNLSQDVHLVRFEPGKIELRPTRHAPPDIHGKLGQLLGMWTEERWVVTLSNEPGDPTLAEQDAVAAQARKDHAETDPLVQAVKKNFPDARITKVVERMPEAPMDDMMAGEAAEDEE